MAKVNPNYQKLPGSYLFSEIARRTAAYSEAHPEAKLIKMGIGDVNATGPVARVAAVVLSILSIFYIALLTGVVVSYCTTAIKARQEGTLANFAANLERLDEMTPEELAAFSKRVREYRRTR